MLKYPQSTSAQQVLLAPLQTLLTTVPAIEQFVTFISDVESSFDLWSAGALQNISQIAFQMAKVLDYLHDSQVQSVFSSQYLLKMTNSAYKLYAYAALASSVATGTRTLSISVSAQTALFALSAWDPVQGYQAPSDPTQLANSLMTGVVIT